MNIKSISFKNIEEKTENIYEAVSVISERARQVLRGRLVARALQETDEEEYGVLDEIPVQPTEVELEKPSSIALEEFLEGELTWRKPQIEDISIK